MWTRFKNWFRTKFCHVDWQHVGIFEKTFRYDYDDWMLYVHCFESQRGDRRIEIVGCREERKGAEKYNSGLEDKFKITKLYQTQLYPWLCGRADAGIPGYELVKSQKFDFTKKLKGETPLVLNDDEK
jgi:hypothetical protein